MENQRAIMDYIQLAADFLAKQGCDSARLDAELLLGYVLHMERMQLYVQFDKPLTAAEVDAYRTVIGRRARRIPVSQIIGEREFLSRRFEVTEHVLTPRPETELLVEAVLERMADWEQPKILDIGTGSGAIAISLACQLPEAIVTAVDISPKALAVARRNAAVLGVDVEFLESDLFTAVADRQFHCIVSNPPYIPTDQLASLPPEVRYEPQLALDGGADGLTVYRQIVKRAGNYLVSSGSLLLEIGCDQGESVPALLQTAGWNHLETRTDYAGRDRVVVALWRA